MHRLDVLAAASEAISGDRAESYGPLADNWGATAEMMTAVLRRAGKLKDGAVVTPYEGLLLLVAVKLARAAYKPKGDTMVDGAGYFALAAEVSDGE